MKTIIKGLIDNDFRKNFDLKDFGFETNFEHFCHYSLMKKEFNGHFDVLDISTGTFQGIDGIAIIVNNIYIETTKQLEEVIENSPTIKVKFIISQSKTSESYDTKELLNFFNAIKDFFSDTHALELNREVMGKLDIKDILWNNFAKMDGEPVCKLYFETLSPNAPNDIVQNIIVTQEEDLRKLGYFSVVSCALYNANDIRQIYGKATEDTKVTFAFKSTPVTIPCGSDEVDEAFWGLVDFAEFKKLIMKDNGEIKNVFEDNVRDYQGDTNPVNQKVDETLKSDRKYLFPILNNGVTVVAEDKVTIKGNTEFTIKNYQIVNGCQTSNTLYNNKDNEDIDEVVIPIKLIFTKKDTIKNQITIATNSQTKIEDEQLLALLDFQKNLELFYKTQASEQLVYERRTGQYDNNPGIQKIKIIDKTNQLKSISSMFLDLPHLASGYKGKLFKDVSNRLFKNEHKLLPYYASSVLLYKIEKLIRNGNIERTYNKARYHLLMLIKYILIGNKSDDLNSKHSEANSKKILLNLENDEKVIAIIRMAISIMDQAGVNIEEKGALYTEENISKLKSKFFELEKNETYSQFRDKKQ